MSEITIIVAFMAGLLSFLSPCVLPLIPGFLSYLSGVTLGDKSANVRLKVLANTVFFVLGFSVVFALVGVLLNSLFSDLAYGARIWAGRIGGAIIILFGLFSMGLLKVDFLEREHKLAPAKTRYAYLTSFIFGASFAVGWTPCVGAVLGSVLTLAALDPASSFLLLIAYSAGLSVPFLITGVFTGEISRLIKKHQRFMGYFNVLMGILLVMLGILVFTGTLAQYANFSFLTQYLPGVQ